MVGDHGAVEEEDRQRSGLSVWPVAVWVLFAAWLVFGFLALADSGHGELLGGLVVVVVMNLMMVASSRGTRKRVMARASDSLSVDQRAQAWRASGHGPVPTDLGVRQEARRLAEWRDSNRPPASNRGRVLVWVVPFGLLVAGWVSSPWWWGAAACSAVVLVGNRREQRRVDLYRASLRTTTCADHGHQPR